MYEQINPTHDALLCKHLSSATYFQIIRIIDGLFHEKVIVCESDDGHIVSALMPDFLHFAPVGKRGDFVSCFELGGEGAWTGKCQQICNVGHRCVEVF